jgi:DNA-binding beta-propeller fold protein YncE
MKKNIFHILVIILLCSCIDEPLDTVFSFPVTDKGVFIACEGNFLYGNGSVSFYNPEKKQAINKLFYARNNAPLGDVVQSLAFNQERLFIVVNNSGKIVVTDAATIEFKGIITGLTSPRYIHFISDEKAYVSDLYASHITIINPQNLAITGFINLGPHTAEQMVQMGRYVFTSHWSYGESLLVIDTETDSLVNKIKVPLQPRDLVLDRNGKIWVLSDGGFEGSVAGKQLPAISRIDPETFTIEQIYRFSEGALPSNLKINNTGDTVLYINKGIYKMAINSRQLPGSPFIEGGGKLFYSMGIDPLSNDLYISDAIDYTQNAIVYRYSQQKIQIDSFKVGINPSFFLFR